MPPPDTPDTMDEVDRTPLSRAARNGHVGIIIMLWETKHLTPDTTGEKSPTSLSWAANRGHIRVAGVLLNREELVRTSLPQTTPVKQNLHPLPRDDMGEVSSDGRDMGIPFLSQRGATPQQTFPQLGPPSHPGSLQNDPEILTFTTIPPHPTTLSHHQASLPIRPRLPFYPPCVYHYFTFKLPIY